MTRKAILIESSNVEGLHDLPGARVDLENWTNFLKTDLGGHWLDSEIVPLSKPWSSDFQAALTVPSDCYCFVAFSGHGSNGSVALNDQFRNYPISSLKPKTEKGTLIVDACRGVADPGAHARRVKLASLTESLVTAVAVEALQGKSVQFCSASDRAPIMNRSLVDHRSRWDEAVRASLRGTVEMLACAKGQAASEDPAAGGYYTSLLMQSAERWDQRTDEAAIHSRKRAAIENAAD